MQSSSFLVDSNSGDSEDDVHMELSLHLWRQRKYSRAEQEEIVKYVVRHGAYGLLKGTAFWKMMEENMVCKKRTWQSMKEQFLKKILPNIESFNLSESHITMFKNLKSGNARGRRQKQNLKKNVFQESTDQLNRRIDSSSENNDNQSNSDVEHWGDQNEQCFLSRSSNFYTEEEDKALLKFVMQRKGYGRAGGVQLWKWMERKQAVPGRSWQSMKERYRKILIKKLDQYLPSDVVTKIMEAEVKRTGQRTKKRKPPSTIGILSTQNPEVGSTQMTEHETNIRSKVYPNHPTLGCTCCFNSSTNTSTDCVDSTMSLPSSNTNKRESPQNHIHVPKRKLFSQKESLIEFTPVSEDEEKIQSSKYLYKPRLRLHRLKLDSTGDDRGRNSGVRVAEVACAHRKSQQSKDIAAHGTRKSDVTAHNTQHSCHNRSMYQEKETGKSDGSYRKENTCEESRMLVREGNLLKFKSASKESTLQNTTLHLNSEARKICNQDLQICLVRCDSSKYLSGASSSTLRLNIISDRGMEGLLNVPDSSQEMTDDEVPKELAERSYIENIPTKEQTVLCKESKIKVTSIKGGKKGEMLNDGIHENISDKGKEVQRKSNRQILQDWSAMEELSCGKPQDEVQNVHFTSNGGEITHNCEERSKSKYVATQQSTDVQLHDRTVSVGDHEEVTGDKDFAVEANKEKHVARIKNSCDVENATEFSSKQAANMNHGKSVQSHHNTEKLTNKRCLNEVMPHKKSGNCVLEVKRYGTLDCSGKELFIEEMLSLSNESVLHITCTPEASAQKLAANDHMRVRSDGIAEKSSYELNLEDLSDNESLLKDDCFTHIIIITPKTQSDDKITITRSLSQSSSSEASEIHSCSYDNSFNGEDVASGGNGHNILKLKHIPDNQHNNIKSSEKADTGRDEIDEECIENNKSTNLIHMQPCIGKNDHRELQVLENISGEVDIDSYSEGGNDIPMFDTYKVDGQSADQLIFSNSIIEMLNDGEYILAANQFEILNFPDITFTADENQQESSIGHIELASKETAITRILSPDSRTTNNTDPRVFNSGLLDLAVEKIIPSTSQNGHISCTEFADKEYICPLSIESVSKSAQSQTQATLCNAIENGQTMDSKSSSGGNNPNRKLSLCRQVRKNGEKYLSHVLGSSLDKSDEIVVFQKCKQNENCINSTISTEKNETLDDLSQREKPTDESLHAVSMLQQTHEISKTTHSFPSNSSLSSCVERSYELTPETFIANAGQQSQEQCSFFCPSQESVSSSSPPSEESAHNQKKGLTGRYLEQAVSSEHTKGNSARWFESSTENSSSSAQQSVCSSGHDVYESCCSLTASTACTNDNSAHSTASKKLKKRQWWKSKDCSICDRCETMEPCMEDT